MSAVDMAAVEDRLAEKSLGGNYGIFTPLGGGLAVIGLALFVFALLGEGSHRAWQTFHVNWVFWTGLTAGSIAITAVSKIANAKWNGLLIRFSQASSAMIPVSLVGLVLILTLGYHDIYGHMQEALHGVSAGKATWLSRPWMSIRLIGGLALLYWIGAKLIRADLLPDLARVKRHAGGSMQARYDRMLAGYDAEANHHRIYRLAPTYAVTYALIMTIVARRTRFGRYVFATGGNPEAAELSGIDTRWLTVKIFALMGALTAIAAVIASARLNAVGNDLGTLDELRVIAAAVIGGTALAGGVGTIYGAVLGALIMQSLQSGMAMVGVDAPLQSIVVGVVLVFAVWVDIVYRRRTGS